MAENRKPVALNPNAQEFYPKQKQPIPQIIHTFHYATPTMLSSNNGLAYYSNQNYMLPPRLKPRKTFCNQKRIPPRLLKKKIYVQKNHDNKSSVMIRNIPNNLGRKDLLKILDEYCGKENKEANEQQQTCSSYDFLYLPMDFRKHANLGYAFVNFTSSVAAYNFRKDFDNFFWPTPGNKKYCRISMAKIQGKEKLSKHFKDSRFACHSDDYLPVVLSPPSDGFTSYSLTTVGYRVDGIGGIRRRSKVV